MVKESHVLSESSYRLFVFTEENNPIQSSFNEDFHSPCKTNPLLQKSASALNNSFLSTYHWW